MSSLKFIHITDCHFVPPGNILRGIDPKSRFDRLLSEIQIREHGVEFVVLTGDLVDRGKREAYSSLKQSLEKLKLPLHLIIGNHDNREKFLEAFPESPVDEYGFVQWKLETDVGVFLFLDTINPGVSQGIYCEKRRNWLHKQLEELNGRPVYLCQHHPPFDCGMPAMDFIRLTNDDEFYEVLKEHPNIRHMFFGHLHRPLSGSWRGIPFSTLYATAHQVVMDFEAPNYSTSSEPPAYSVVLINEDSVVVHTRQIDLPGGA